jgi:hypothetical protein
MSATHGHTVSNEETIAEYMVAAREDPNPDVFLAAVGDAARARGVDEQPRNIHRAIQAYWGDSRGEHHRYLSWEHCYQYFQGQGQTGIRRNRDTAALHLGFYLASWGMYRGSSFLLQRDYKVHMHVVDVLADSAWAPLWGQDLGTSRDDAELTPVVMGLVSAVRGAYRPYVPVTGTAQPTDTLVTKIILGTLGIVPACDRFFIDGLKVAGLKYSYVNEVFVGRMVAFCQEHLGELRAEQEAISARAGVHYPLMKLVDMYFWQVGFEGGPEGSG